MKKVLFGLLPFFIMAICISSLTACSSDDEDSPIVGTWKEVYENGGNVYTTTFVFNADGTGVRTLRQEQGGIGVTVDPIKLYYTYDPQSTNISLKFDGDDTLYTFEAFFNGVDFKSVIDMFEELLDNYDELFPDDECYENGGYGY